MSAIDMRFGQVMPPETEPEHTIYTDLVSLSDPVVLGLSPKIFNNDAVNLYFKVTGIHANWTFTEQTIGLIAAGGSLNKVFDNMGTRAKPASETIEEITFRLRAYTDAGYSNLKWTFDRKIEIQMLKSDDGSWTLDQNWNFDDGTVQGWTGSATTAVATDFYLSASYSLKMTAVHSASGEANRSVQRVFTTPNRNKVFAIINIRLDRTANVYPKDFTVLETTVVKVFLGIAYAANTDMELVMQKWMRLMVPLTKNTSITMKLNVHGYTTVSGTYYLWTDDVQVISKD